MTSEPLYLIDGSGYIFRAFFAIPSITRKDGTPTNAVYGFCAMIHDLVFELQAKRIAVIFDAAKKTFRNEIYPQYKTNRKPTPENLSPQMPLVRDAAKAAGLPTIEMKGYEADDLIATYARAATEQGIEVVIVSSDKDLMQLVNSNVHMYDPLKKKDIGPKEVYEKFGVYPDKVIDVQALAGDSVDNVPGVQGIGIKTAAQLISQYGSLENVLSSANEVKQAKKRENLMRYNQEAIISKRLVTLHDRVPVTETVDELTINESYENELHAFLQKMEFISLIKRFGLEGEDNV